MRWVDLAVIRSTKDGFLVLLDEEGEFETVLGQLRGKLTSAGDFFRGAAMVVDVGQRPLTAEHQEALRQLLEAEHGISLRELVTDSPERRRSQEDPRAQARPAPPEGEAQQPRTAQRPQQMEDSVLIVNRTLRSGQRVYHDGTVLIIGDVNPGAEVVAAGDIVVMGAFRGVAHAGAHGAAHSIVAAVCLAPTQLRIAGCIGRAPDEGPEPRVQPEMALIRDGMVVIEPYPGRL